MEISIETLKDIIAEVYCDTIDAAEGLAIRNITVNGEIEYILRKYGIKEGE